MAHVWLVYVIRNSVNGKMYVGKTNNLSRRWHGHQYQARAGHRTPLHRAIRKYGAHSFTREVHAYFPSETDAYAGERDLISKWKTNRPRYGYNRTAGADGSMASLLSDATRARMSESHRGIIPSAETLRRRGESISAAKRGMRMSDRHAATLAAARAKWLGQHQSEDARRKISEAGMGRQCSESHREKLSHAKKSAGLSKLTDADVVSIRVASKAGATRTALAAQYGVDISLVSQIVLGKARTLAGGPISEKRRSGRIAGVSPHKVNT